MGYGNLSLEEKMDLFCKKLIQHLDKINDNYKRMSNQLNNINNGN